MHPLLARGRLLGLYLGLWVMVGGQLGAILLAQAGLAWTEALLVALPLATLYAFVCLSAWYVSRGVPLVSTGPARVVATALAAAVVSSILWLVAARLWMRALGTRGWLPAGTGPAPDLDVVVFGLGVLLYLLSIAVSYLVAVLEERADADRRALQVQVSAREAELRSLRAQIDPHFLFNSLQSISALTTADPAGARRMCLLLAEFLRDSLALGGEDRIPLARELTLVERFLAIERVRFGPRLDVEIAAGDAGPLLVPPLLLQPIVENAVTHGIAHVLDGGTLRVVASRSAARLTLVIENPCDADRPRGRGAGLGLANVRARLQALHGSDARMEITEEEGVWRVEMSLPAMEAAEGKETEERELEGEERRENAEVLTGQPQGRGGPRRL